MKWKCFTPEEVEELRKNPYTYKVTAQTISFTAEFKRIFWEKSEAGWPSRDILEEMGYDPEILGQTRIYGIKLHIKEQVMSGEGVHEGRKDFGREMTSDELVHLPPSKAMIKMVNELAYLRQEVEFLKKAMRTGNQRKPGK